MSAGANFGTILNFFAIGFLCEPMALLINILILASNPYNLSADAVMTMTYLMYALMVFPVVFLVALIIHHIIVSHNEASGLV
jgi:hypothetical protein